MNYDDLLRLATMGGGTGPDLAALRDRSSLPAPPAQPAPMPLSPQEVAERIAASRATAANVPGPSPLSSPADFGSVVMGQPGIFERVAQAGEHNPIIGPISVLSDLVSAILRRGQTGIGDLEQRRGLNTLEAELDNQSRQKQEKLQQEKRQLQTTIEEENRQANRERDRLNRQNRLQTVRERIAQGKARINVLTALEQTPEVMLEAKQLAQAVSKWESVEAGLVGEEALAGVPSPLKPAGGKRAGTDSDKAATGGYVTVTTPDGPKLMLASEAAAKGFVPVSVSGTRAPAPQEREHLVEVAGLMKQINRVREAFNPAFVGPLSGRVSKLQAKGLIPGLEEGKTTFLSQVAAIRNAILKAKAGSAVTEAEAARLLEELPTAEDPSESFVEKMEGFERTLRDLHKSRLDNLAALGVDVSKIPGLADAVPWSKRGKQRPKPNEAAGSDLPPGAVQVRADSTRVP